MTAVQVHALSKNYPLSDSQLGRLRHLFGSGKQGSNDVLWALRDVSFSVARGEAFGIIGANGSGKSTLLQIVAGILRPTSGSVEVNGRLSALLELGSGFSPEFTGRDNVFLNASLLGLSREETDERFAAIERFAEIGDFIGQPIRTYSTGMVLRLAFAVAAHVDPEILIVDEALAVGDIAFRQRCMRKIHELRAHGTTILFVSHETSDVKALCERCLWLRHGVAEELGEADEVVAKYLSATLHKEVATLHKEVATLHKEVATLHKEVATLHKEVATRHKEVATRHKEVATLHKEVSPGTIPAAAHDHVHVSEQAIDRTDASPLWDGSPACHRYGDGRAIIIGTDLLDPSGQSVREAGPLQQVVLRIGFRVNAPLASPIAGFLVRNHRGESIFGTNTARENYPLPPMSGGDANNVDFHCSIPELAPGIYRISLAVSDGDVENFEVCDYIEDALEVTARAGPESRTMASREASSGYFRLRCAAVTIHSN